MRRAVEEPNLWQRLVDGIVLPRTIADAAAEQQALRVNLLS